MAQVFNHEQAAAALADAAINGDAQAVQRAQITLRTLQNYRNRLPTDPKLSQYFAEKKSVLLEQWADKLAPAVRECIAFVMRAARDGNHKDPEMVHAIAGAFKLLTDADMNRRVLDAYLAQLAADPAATASSGAHAVPRAHATITAPN